MSHESEASRDARIRSDSGGCDEPFAVDYVHRLRFTQGVFAGDNLALRDVIVSGGATAGTASRAIVVVDAGVAAAWPDLSDEIASYAERHADILRLTAPPLIVPGGEAAKNDRRVYDAVIELIDTGHICRHSWVLVIGGGAVLDAVGFAAATAHRGVRLVRFPTTTLAQGDAGLGVKNGINARGKKNFLGAFAVPWAVINDERFLASLDDQAWRDGISEAVKVALLKDAQFFAEIEHVAPRLRARELAPLLPIIRRSAELHLEHISRGGDPFERRNARPLDFGHWSAHKLEQLTEFRVSHGSAVAMGVALDTVYSELDGRLDAVTTERVLRTLGAVGFELFHPGLRDPRLIDGLEEFREHLGGRLTITLLSGLGYPVDVHSIDRDRMMEAIECLATRAPEVHVDHEASPSSRADSGSR